MISVNKIRFKLLARIKLVKVGLFSPASSFDTYL